MDNEIIGYIENAVKDARLVEDGIVQLERYRKNAPLFSLDRRHFLKYAAKLAGLSILFKTGIATETEAFLFQKRSWESSLLGQDLIRGPELLVWKGQPNGFEQHLSQPVNEGFGAVDYEVPLGTPITPICYGTFNRSKTSHSGGNSLWLRHKNEFGSYRSGYLHLDSIVNKSRSQAVNLKDIVAISGNSGYINTESQPEHLHLAIAELNEKWTGIGPGLDPFILGVDGRRPIYWDTKAEIEPDYPWTRESYLQRSFETLDERIKEAEVENQTKREVLSRRIKPEELKSYLGREVLQKHQGRNGEVGYKYLPGHFMYSLMLEVFAYTSKQPFIAMLPFPHPMLKSFYQKENPGLQF
ncbi:MAG: M23 family metallopeptidase [Candidatus Aenigmarchaeota archaeon]|nr:M23 family metallopeptidase [Candidatus Aenigmarchaeota archaeon]